MEEIMTRARAADAELRARLQPLMEQITAERFTVSDVHKLWHKAMRDYRKDKTQERADIADALGYLYHDYSEKEVAA